MLLLVVPIFVAVFVVFVPLSVRAITDRHRIESSVLMARVEVAGEFIHSPRFECLLEAVGAGNALPDFANGCIESDGRRR
jgi:hypothetical protein